MASKTKILTLSLLLAVCLAPACAGCQKQQADGFLIGCSNNVAGMLVHYAVAELADENLAAEALLDCCSSKSTWSLTTGELDAAVLCPDAAAAFLAEAEGYLIAGPLTYRTEMVVLHGQQLPPQRIGYMNGQDRQYRELIAHYDATAEYFPVLAMSLPYALGVGELDAAVLDLGTAVTLDYDYTLLPGEEPTAVLLVSERFYRSEQYPALLQALEEATAAIQEYEAFCEAMQFLSSEEMGRKEYEKWLATIEWSATIDGKQFPDLGQILPPPQHPSD